MINRGLRSWMMTSWWNRRIARRRAPRADAMPCQVASVSSRMADLQTKNPTSKCIRVKTRRSRSPYSDRDNDEEILDSKPPESKVLGLWIGCITSWYSLACHAASRCAIPLPLMPRRGRRDTQSAEARAATAPMPPPPCAGRRLPRSRPVWPTAGWSPRPGAARGKSGTGPGGGRWGAPWRSMPDRRVHAAFGDSADELCALFRVEALSEVLLSSSVELQDRASAMRRIL